MTTITTTLGALSTAEAALAKILALKFDQAGGAKLRYHLVKLARLVTAETKPFYEERNALIARWGEGEPKSMQPTSPNWAAFMAEVKSLSEVAVTIPWGPLTDAMVEPYSEITAADLLGLGPLYECDSQPTVPQEASGAAG